MQTKNFVKDIYLINYKLYNDAEVYNTTIVEYLSVAKEIVINLSKLYLYQVQNKNENAIKDCFEPFDSITETTTNFLKLSTKLKEIKISTFENYNYLQNDQFYPNIGYSLYHIDDKGMKIALLETYLSSSYLPFLSKVITRLVCQWEVEPIDFYKNFFLNTPRIIKNIGEKIFEFSDNKNHIVSVNGGVPQEKIIIAEQKYQQEKESKKHQEKEGKKNQEKEGKKIVKEKKDSTKKESEKPLESNKHFSFLGKLKNALWGAAKNKKLNESVVDSSSGSELSENNEELENLMKSIAENKEQEELINSIIQSVHKTLVEQKVDQIEEDEEEQEEVSQLQQPQQLQKSKFPINGSKLMSIAGNDLSASKYYAYQTVINELYDNLNVNDDTSTLIQKCRKVMQIENNIKL